MMKNEDAVVELLLGLLRGDRGVSCTALSALCWDAGDGCMGYGAGQSRGRGAGLGILTHW
jgi:hypothetical protein